jgi:hypothetical protein
MGGTRRLARWAPTNAILAPWFAGGQVVDDPEYDYRIGWTDMWAFTHRWGNPPMTRCVSLGENGHGKPRVVDHHERGVCSSSEAFPKLFRPSWGRSRDRACRGREPAVPRDRFQSLLQLVTPCVVGVGHSLGSESGWARNPSTPRLATLLPRTGPRRPLAAHEPVGTCGICRPYGRLAHANGLNRPLIYLRSRFRFPAPPLFCLVDSRGCKEKER